MSNPKIAAYGVFGFIAPVVASIMTVVDNFSAILRLGILLLGGLAAFYSFLMIRHNMKKAVAEEQIAEANLCALCQSGHPPPECPIPVEHRPKNCYADKHEKKPLV